MLSNKFIRNLSKNKYRKNQGVTLIEGPRFIKDLLINTKLIKEVFVLSAIYNQFAPLILDLKKAGIAVFKKSLAEFKKLSDTVNSQGMIAVVKIPNYSLSEMINSRSPRFIFLDRIQDSGNLGTILRTSLSFGINGAILNCGCADPYSPKSIRSSAGCSLRLPIFNVNNDKEIISFLKEKGFQILATSSKGNISCDSFVPEGKSCIIFGNEGHGIYPDLKKISDISLYIPTLENMGSLNVGVAAGIVLFSLFGKRTI